MAECNCNTVALLHLSRTLICILYRKLLDFIKEAYKERGSGYSAMVILGMAIVPANPQTRPNPPAKTRPLRVILPVAGGFSIITRTWMRVGLVLTLYPVDTRMDIHQTRNIFFKYF